MKKIIAVLLSMICAFSVFTLPASAAVLDDMEELFKEFEDDSLYCITYQKETLSDVSMMYKPNPSVSFSGPGYLTVTSDEPLAVDHDFICWRDKEGNLYYAGDKIYIDGEVTLYAVWEEKKDNDPHAIRVVRTAILTFIKMIRTALGIFKDIQDFDKDYNVQIQTAVEEYINAYNTTKAMGTLKGSSAMVCDEFKLDLINVESMQAIITENFCKAPERDLPLPPDSGSDEALITTEDIRIARYHDNQDGTATLLIVPQACSDSEPLSDPQGKMFNVFTKDEVLATMDSITELNWSEGTAEENVSITNAGGYAQVTYNTETYEIICATYVLVSYINFEHANFLSFANENGYAKIVYTMNFPAVETVSEVEG